MRYSCCPMGHNLEIVAGRADNDVATVCGVCRKPLKCQCILSCCCLSCPFDLCGDCVTDDLVLALQTLLDQLKVVVSC